MTRGLADLGRIAALLLVATFTSGMGSYPQGRPGGFVELGFPFSDNCAVSAHASVLEDPQTEACSDNDDDPGGVPPRQVQAGCQAAPGGVSQAVDATASTDGQSMQMSVSVTNSGTPILDQGHTRAQCFFSETEHRRFEVRMNVFDVSTGGPPSDSGFFAPATVFHRPNGQPTSDQYPLENGQTLTLDLGPLDFVSIFFDLFVNPDAPGTFHAAGEVSWSYIGGVCFIDADCQDPFYPYCVNGECQDGAPLSSCVDGGDCRGGEGCVSGLCEPRPGSQGQFCIQDEDCLPEHACVQNTCERFFPPAP